jgi:hypothetical protein
MDEFVDLDRETQRVVDALNAYSQAPRADLRDVHLARIDREAAPLRIAAQTGSQPADHVNPRLRWRFRMSLKRLAVVPAAAVVALFTMAGLAAAGVNLPGTARAPFDAVGVQLPNQSRAGDVHAVIDATQPGDRGCAFGHAVAQAASQGRTHAPDSACNHQQGAADEEGAAHGQGAAHDHGQNVPNGPSESAPQENAGSQPSGVPPAPPDGRAFGQQTASDAQQNASSGGQAFGQSTSQNAQNLTPATPPAGAGEQGATGQSHAAAGSSNASDTPAGSAPGGSPGP